MNRELWLVKRIQAPPCYARACFLRMQWKTLIIAKSAKKRCINYLWVKTWLWIEEKSICIQKEVQKICHFHFLLISGTKEHSLYLGECSFMNHMYDWRLDSCFMFMFNFYFLFCATLNWYKVDLTELCVIYWGMMHFVYTCCLQMLIAILQICKLILRLTADVF